MITARSDVDGPEAITQVLIRPVFRDGSARRQRLLRRAGCGIAALCLAYLTMLGVSITAVPVLRTPSDTGTARGLPAPTPHAPARRNPATRAQARLPAPNAVIPDIDRDDVILIMRPGPTPPATPTRVPQQAPPTTAPAHHTHQHAAKTPTATPAVATTRAPADHAT